MSSNSRVIKLKSEDIIGSEANLECRIEAIAVAKLPQSVTNLPFEDSLGALEETIQLLSYAHFRATIFEECLVEGLIQVRLRAFRNVLRTTQMWHSHFQPLGLGFLLRRESTDQSGRKRIRR